jgi:hypothetical protein
VIPVVMPFVGTLHPVVVAAVPGARLVRMEGPYDYWEHLSRLWKAGRGFVVVEHDMVLHPGAAEGLAICPGDWCAHPYPLLGSLQVGLGCTKFSAALTARRPRLIDDLVERFWADLDYQINVALVGAGEEVCLHRPAVQHLNEETVAGATEVVDGVEWPRHFRIRERLEQGVGISEVLWAERERELAVLVQP